MSDTPETPATPTVDATNPAPAAPAAPESTQPERPASPDQNISPEPVAPTYDPAQIEKWQRTEQRYNGDRPLVEAAMQAGFKSPNDFQAVGELRALADEKGLDLQQLTNVLRGQQPQSQPQSQPEQDQFLTEDKLVSVLDQRDALAQFNSELTAMDTAVGAMRQEVAQATGLDANDQTLNLIVNSLLDKVQNTNLYPEHHVLHQTKLKPLDGSQIAQAKDEAIQSITAFRGQHAIATAKESLNSVPAQPTGSGLQSKPGEGVSQIYNPHSRRSQNDVSDAASILARTLGSTQPGVVANSV